MVPTSLAMEVPMHLIGLPAPPTAEDLSLVHHGWTQGTLLPPSKLIACHHRGIGVLKRKTAPKDMSEEGEKKDTACAAELVIHRERYIGDILLYWSRVNLVMENVHTQEVLGFGHKT